MMEGRAAMKIAIVIPDGAADEPQESLNGQSPLEAARNPEMDRVAADGLLGRSRNVPDVFLPASDVATLSLFGYDPERHYTGRAPLEVVAMGIPMGPDDWAVRCNLMTIENGRLTDFTAEHITTEEGRELITAIQQNLHFEGHDVEFHPGVSYRNAMIYRGRPDAEPFAADTFTRPPHDVPDQPVEDHLPTGTGAELLRSLMKAGSDLIRPHPVNVARVDAGKRPANAIWLWGQGKAPQIPKFRELHRIDGAIISAVDLVRGTGTLAGWKRIDVPGATGYLDTDYGAKGRAAIQALDEHDLVCVHVEAPDEASHEGRPDAKIEAIERIDEDIVGPLRQKLESFDSWRLLVSPDHATLLRTRAHDRAPVPWALCGTGIDPSGGDYNERIAAEEGRPLLDQGWRLMGDYVLRR